MNGRSIYSAGAQTNAGIETLTALGGLPIGAGLGDSLTAQMYTSSASTSHFQPYGYLTWVRQQLAQQMYLDPDFLFATSGYTSQEIVDTHLGPLLRSGASYAFIMMGQNDFPNPAISAATTANNTILAADQCLANGILPIVTTPPPRTDSMDATDQLKRNDVFNRLQDNFDRKNVVFVDTDPWLANPDGTPAHANTDNIHFTVRAAQIAANQVVGKLQNRLAYRNRKYRSNLDVYDATTNPRGNLYIYGALAGTGGALGASGVTGVCADGHTLDNFTAAGSIGSAAIVGSKLASTDGDTASWQVITGSGTPSADFTWRFRPTTAPSAGFVAGDLVYAQCEYYVVSGCVGLLQAGLRVAYNTNVFFARDAYYLSGVNGPFQTAFAQTGFCRTKPFVLGASPTGLQLVFEVTQQSGVAASFEVRVRRMVLKKVV